MAKYITYENGFKKFESDGIIDTLKYWVDNHIVFDIKHSKNHGHYGSWTVYKDGKFIDIIPRVIKFEKIYSSEQKSVKQNKHKQINDCFNDIIETKYKSYFNKIKNYSKDNSSIFVLGYISGRLDKDIIQYKSNGEEIKYDFYDLFLKDIKSCADKYEYSFSVKNDKENNNLIIKFLK